MERPKLRGEHPWRDAQSGVPAEPQLPQLFFCWLLEGSSLMMLSLMFMLTSAWCILHKLTRAKPNYDSCGSFSRLYIGPLGPSMSGPVLHVKCRPAGLLGRVMGKGWRLSRQRLAAALLSLSDLALCGSPAGPDFLICEKV